MTLAEDLKPCPHKSVTGLVRDRLHAAPASRVLLLVTSSVRPRPKLVP